MEGMTDLDALFLDIATRHYAHAGARDQAIVEETGLSVTRFWQAVNRLIDDPAILAARPVEVSRLRRLRASRQRSRASRLPTG